jgi:ferredoxin-type protein NapH
MVVRHERRMSSAKWKILRRVVQVSVVAVLLSPAFGFTFFTGTLVSGELFGVSLTDPLAAVDHTLATRSFAPVIVAGALLLVVFYFLVGGRVFCSWVCPVHLVTELAGKLRPGPVFRLKRRLSRKYWVLGVVLLLSLVVSAPVFEIFSPIGAVTQNIALGFRGESAIPGSGAFGPDRAGDETANMGVATDTGRPRFYFNLSLLLLLFIALMEIFWEKGWWCGYTCPVGALYSLVGRWSPLRIRMDYHACDKCGD